METVANTEEATVEKKAKKESFSYSKLSKYKSCPFHYKLNYVDGIYAGSSNMANRFGNLVHETEETIGNTIIANQPIDYIALKNKFIIDFNKLAFEFKSTMSEVDEIGKTYYEKAYMYLETGIYRLEQFLKENTNIKLIGTEVKFRFDYCDGKNYNGSIDRVFYDSENNKYIVQDIKTWPSMSKHMGELKESVQFTVYSYAMKDLYGVEPADVMCQYYLPLVNVTANTLVENSTLVQNGTETIKGIYEGIQANKFYPIASALCAWCEFSPTNPDQTAAGKNKCPYHSVWNRELREKGTAKRGACKWEGLDQHELVLQKYIQMNGGEK